MYKFTVPLPQNCNAQTHNITVKIFYTKYRRETKYEQYTEKKH